MGFGQIIKQLRRRADMTQEQLAETLSISGQAVSRWENDLAMPDISLLPVLANLFDVTTDYLLGVDIAKKEENIRQILRDAGKWGDIGHSKEAADIVRAGLREYPRSYELMHWLQHYLYYSLKQCEENRRGEMQTEILDLGEKILEGCTDDLLRYETIDILCQTYAQSGNLERAAKLANSLPTVWVTRDALLAKICTGQAQFDAKRVELTALLNLAIVRMGTLNTRLDDGTWALSPEEDATMFRNVLKLIEMLCPDGDYGSCVIGLMRSYTELAFLCLDRGDVRGGLDWLKQGMKHYIAFDTTYDGTIKHTSLLLRDREYGRISFMNTENGCLSLLNRLKNHPSFEKIQADTDGREILSQFETYAARR